MTVYMSSGAFRVRTVPGVIDEAERLRTTHIELSSGLEHDPNLDQSIQRGMDSGLTFLVHNYFPAPAEPRVLNLSSQDEEGMEWSIAHCKKAIDLAVRVGCPFYSLHAGYAAPITADLLGKPAEQALAMRDVVIDRSRAYARMLEAVQDVADYGQDRGIRLLIENNVISPLYLNKIPENPLLMTDADEIERFMGDVNRTNVGFLIDVAHARVSATALGFDPIRFMEQVSPYTEALHLSDNDTQEDQNLPFDESSWFWPILSEYLDRPFVIEAYNLSDGEIRKMHNSLSCL